MISAAAIASAVGAAFLASFVEAVEALTIVLAVGLIRGWRPALGGAGAALAALAAIVALLGPLLGLVPIALLQYAVGALLILFGLRWLRKAILRAAGLIALHDEERAFAAERDELARQAAERQADFLAGLVAFKGVLLEGLEVVFIVIAVGAGRAMLGYASLGAAAASALVIALGLIIHRPLARVPENALKFVVGIMLTSFGIFWTGEGLGAVWPGEDLAIPAIALIIALFALAAVATLRGAARARRALET
ncbi:MAG TPA: hypothetical protein VKS78_17235 [Roseiarcus sp.]|nr:hypothetical protein [Roseiarcus sp.]